MSEMRVQAASLLCKVFLQYLVLLSEWDGIIDLWIEIIDIMDRLMNSGQGDSLVSIIHLLIALPLVQLSLTFDKEEAVQENLKNVVLFMASSGFLVAPAQDSSKRTLWDETWKRLDRFLPDLRSDLALDAGSSSPELETTVFGAVDQPAGDHSCTSDGDGLQSDTDRENGEKVENEQSQ